MEETFGLKLSSDEILHKCKPYIFYHSLSFSQAILQWIHGSIVHELINVFDPNGFFVNLVTKTLGNFVEDNEVKKKNRKIVWSKSRQLILC